MFTQWRKKCSNLRSSVVSTLVRGRKSISGGTAIEFAFAAPVLFMFLFGIIEVGRVMFTQGVMQYALYEASRYAAVHYLDPADKIKDVATGKFILLDPNNVSSFTVTSVDKGDNTKSITLKIDYLFDFTIPMVPTQSITLTADANIMAES